MKFLIFVLLYNKISNALIEEINFHLSSRENLKIPRNATLLRSLVRIIVDQNFFAGCYTNARGIEKKKGELGKTVTQGGIKRGPYRWQVSPLKGKTRTVSVKFFEKPEAVPKDLQRNDEDRARGVNSFLLPLRNTFEILWTTRRQGGSQWNLRIPANWTLEIPKDRSQMIPATKLARPSRDSRALEIYPRWNRRKAATSHWTFPHRRFLRAARFESDTRIRRRAERRETVTPIYSWLIQERGFFTWTYRTCLNLILEITCVVKF